MLRERITTAGRATAILKELVAIESVNPFYPGGGRGEVAMTAWVDTFFHRLGLQPRKQEALPGRENVWATLEVPGATKTLLLESHMDTVTLEPVGRSMLDPSERDGRLWGRGSCDTKASLAAMLTALETLRKRRNELKANVVVLGSVDEEYLMRGIAAFADQGLAIDAAVVGEPTGLNVVRAHKGLVRWEITTKGRAAHTSRPENGDNAIMQMADVIRALTTELEPGMAKLSHPLLGRPTFTVATIHGGMGVNIVPEHCAITVDRRTLPAERPADVIAGVEGVLRQLRETNPGVKVEIGAPFANIGGLNTAAELPFVQLACRIAGKMPIGVPYGTNAAALAAKGIPTIVFGPGDIAQAHTADEWVDLAQVEDCADLYANLALAFE